MEPFLKKLKEQVTCSICLNIYDDPKTLPCLHTFCYECLTKHARERHRQGTFPCPECRDEIDLPKGNRFASFPTSSLHNSLVSLLAVRQTGDRSDIICDNCGDNSPDVQYCFDCAKFMCPRCLNAHGDMSGFKGHTVMLVKDFQAEDYDVLLKRQPFCSEQYHEREITRFFCFSCQSCVCRECIANDHQNHEFTLLDKAADNEKKNIMWDAELTREKEKALEDVIRKFEETISLLETNVSTAKREVSQAAEQMIAKIREREREAITSLETTRVTRLARINSANEKAQSLLKQICQAVEFAQNLVQRSSSLGVMHNKETLEQRFKELRDIQVPQHDDTSFVKFTAASGEGLRLGDITTEAADASQCTLKGLGQTLQAGGYSTEVKIKGNKLPTCPFTMQVKERELVVVGELELKLFQGDKLQEPHGIAVNTKGSIAITDCIGHCVYIFDKEGNCLRKIGSQGRTAGQFNYPRGVTYLNDNEILIADAGNNRIQHVDVQTGTFVKSFGKRGAAKGEFSFPYDVCLDEQHHIVVTEHSNHRMHVITQQDETISIFGDSGPEKLNRPTSCIPHKNMFLVSDGGNHCIKVFYQSGTFLYKFGTQGNQDGQFDWPRGMLVDRYSNLLVCDSNNDRVQQFMLDGRFTGKTITHLPGPFGIATAPDGRILVASGIANKVYILK